MLNCRYALPVLAASAALALAGCGGGGNSASGMAGIDGTGAPVPSAVVSVGTVTGFGSVIVNGVHFDTTSASFTIDGQAGSQSDLAVGDVVVVHGQLASAGASTGTADSIVFDDSVQGPISAIDGAGSTLTVLGQIVRVGPDTSFDDAIQPRSLAGLAVGDLIEVSGFVGSDGSIAATRIEPKASGAELELTGQVTNLDPVAQTFRINSQTVDYSSASLADFGAAGIAAGDLVEVKAGIALGAGGELIATRVELKGGDVGGSNGEHVDIEGLITRYAGITDFDVSGVRVSTNGNPSIEGGQASDLGIDIKVEVEGTYQGDVFVATRVEIRQSNQIRVNALVDSVDVAGGTIVVLDIVVRVDTSTRLEDKSSLDIEDFALGDLRVGDYVEVRGSEIPAGSGEIRAGLLERDDVSTRSEIRGIVAPGSVVSPLFSILGVTISTNGSTVFRDASGSNISAGTFFAAADGKLVSAGGTETGDAAVLADQVEFEN
jgi:hypothetical protein